MNGPGAGHAFLAFKVEGQFDDLLCVYDDDVGATMKDIPEVEINDTHGSSSTQKQKKRKKRKDGDDSERGTAVDLLQRMERNMSQGERKTEVHHLRHQITLDESA